MKKRRLRLTQNALRRIRKHHPASFDELTNLGVVTRFIGEGAFRQTYRIKGTDLVIKFPNVSSDMSENDCCVLHTRQEFKRINRLREYKSLRPHIPRIYYYNGSTGVIVMRYYKSFRASWQRTEGLSVALGKVVQELTGVSMTDINNSNVRNAGGGKPVFTDLGY